MQYKENNVKIHTHNDNIYTYTIQNKENHKDTGMTIDNPSHSF